MRWHRHDTLDSTMLQARRLIEAYPASEAFCVTADEQTGGIGRHGRHWHSPRGGLWLTFSAPLAVPLSPLTALRAGSLVFSICHQGLEDARRGAADLLRIKWPNDIVNGTGLDAAKLAGVLIQSVTINGQPWVLCGVGVNVLNETDAVTSRPAVSLRTLSGGLHDQQALESLRVNVGAALGTGLITQPENATASDDDTLRIARDFLWSEGLTVPITLPDGSRVHGRIDGLTDDGELLATIDGVQRTLRSIDQLG